MPWGNSTETGYDVHISSSTFLGAEIMGQWSHSFVTLWLWSHSILEFHFPLCGIIPVIHYLIKSLETKQTISRHQVRHCKFSSLLLKALSLTGRNTQFCRAMLRTIDNRGGQLFSLVCPAKENHPVMVISESSGLKGFPRSLHVKLCPGLQDDLC